MKRFCFFINLLFCAASMQSQDLSAYEKHLFIKNGDTLPYRLLLPKNYKAYKNYPLIYFLHGSGERGRDNEKQLVHGGELFLRDSIRNLHPAIVVFPQCPEDSYWSNVDIKKDDSGKREFVFQANGEPTKAMQMAEALLYDLLATYPVNKKRVYAGGLSMGGMGTFEIVRRNPKIFAAAFPICGGADPATARQIKKIHWWVFHGAKDDVVPPASSEKMVDALRKVNADVKFNLYPYANHNSWDNAFAEPGLMDWLFAKKRKSFL